MPINTKIGFKRQVLLIELDRRCFFADCNQRVFVGLTRSEANGYLGFECSACKRWNEDSLSEKDVPEWWEEIQTNQTPILH